MCTLVGLEIEWSSEILVTLWALVLCRGRPLLAAAIVDADTVCWPDMSRVCTIGSFTVEMRGTALAVFCT